MSHSEGVSLWQARGHLGPEQRLRVECVYVYLVLPREVRVESPCVLWSTCVSVLHRDAYQDNQWTQWGALFRMLEGASRACTAPVLRLSFLALHRSSDTGSVPVTHLRRLGERKTCLEGTPSKRERQTNLPSAPKGSPTWQGWRTAFPHRRGRTEVWAPSLRASHSAPASQTLLLWRRPTLSLAGGVASVWFWSFAVRGPPVPRCWAEHPQEKTVHSERLEGNLTRQTRLSKRQIAHVTPSPPVSLPKLVARCQTMQLVTVLFSDETRRCGSWEKGARFFLQNLLQDTTSGSQILVQWSPSLQVTSYNPLWLEPD